MKGKEFETCRGKRKKGKIMRMEPGKYEGEKEEWR